MANTNEWIAQHPEHAPDPRCVHVDAIELARRIATGYYTASKSARAAARSALVPTIPERVKNPWHTSDNPCSPEFYDLGGSAGEPFGRYMFAHVVTDKQTPSVVAIDPRGTIVRQCVTRAGAIRALASEECDR